ncbi:TRAP transporter large permease [Sneathiella chinensis]|uniref:TRAP transporter large permease protein n=1 Tax=Sneathiella chinensis TaxID=349750 RepID=A0ABQ5U591_9PROT|nr:TRAP transporter large permease [Sneathiella chinensis]GLQ07322.1 C4-dicarboxylate ABC transporter permease [Sneathiella chinensis]
MLFPTVFTGLFGLLATGMPIFLALGFLSILLFWEEGTPLVGLPQLVVDHLNSITFLAIPFFVMAATFMQKGGIAKALVNCAYAWVGHYRGGMAVVCVVATAVFAAICGSSVATAMAMGTILIPAMIQRKYELKFATGIVGSSGTLGILIPPSMAFIVYAIIAEQSVPRLFLAGVIPGLIQAALFIGWSIYYTSRKGYEVGEPMSREEFWSTNLKAVPALSLPVIVLGGIYGGLVTVTEAAALSALVAILVSVFFYKGCSYSEIIPTIGESIKRAGTIVFIIMMALAFGHWITGSGFTRSLTQMVTDYNISGWQFLLLINLLMIFLGMFLENFAVLLVVVPLVLPLLEPLGIDPVHFAVVVTVNLELGLLTPPVGLNLFVLTSITKAPIREVIQGTLPFIILMGIFLMLVTYIPELSLWLPNLVYGS